MSGRRALAALAKGTAISADELRRGEFHHPDYILVIAVACPSTLLVEGQNPTEPGRYWD